MNTRKRSPLFQPNSELEIRALVLDYLIHHSYTDTARAFAAESVVRHLDADGDEIPRPEREGDKVVLSEQLLAQANLRLEVQRSILAGNVDSAIEQLHTYFPAVLSPPPKGVSITMSPKSSANQPTLVRTLVPFTVDPARLYLDLRILAFIEASRTTPLGESLQPTPSLTEVSAGPSTDPRDLAGLLRHVLELKERINELEDPADRAGYDLEVEDVSLLMAYTDPERRPVSKYLSQSRREDVANEINYAMLYRSGQSPISSLELAVRQTYAVFGYMNENGYRFPSSSSLPSGISLPFTRSIAVPSTGTEDRERDDTEPIPAFDMDLYLSP